MNEADSDISIGDQRRKTACADTMDWREGALWVPQVHERAIISYAIAWMRTRESRHTWICHF